MKVLLVTVTAGNGHNACAGALEECLRARGHTVMVADIFKQINTALYTLVDKGYLLSTKYTPSQFGLAYRSAEKNEFLHRSMLGILRSELLRDLFFERTAAFEPDAFICTHVFASLIIDEMLGPGGLRALHAGIVTDYTMHPFWDSVRNIDYIVLASEFLRHRAEKRGIDPRKLLGCGIPVRARFTEEMDKAEACRLLDIDAECRTVLFMGGGMGFGNMLPAVKGLAASGMPVQAMCVCGNNEKLARRLRREAFSFPVKVYGFVNNVDVLMSAADCVVTKPGGLTVTEALAKRKPLILHTPIPGVEDENMEFLVNSGLALRATPLMPVEEIVWLLFSVPERLEMMQRAIDAFISPGAADRLCDALEDGSAGKRRERRLR